MNSRIFKPIDKRFQGRQDSEHEQAFVRLCVGIILGCYFSYFTYEHPAYNKLFSTPILSAGLFIILSAAIIVHIALRPGVSVVRRLFGGALDTGTTAYFSFALPELAAPLYSLYLWIIFGHGFRYGRQYLLFTLVLSLIGFGAAVLYVPYWSDKLFLGAGLWIGMLLISGYLSTLVNRLMKALEYAEAANHAKREFVSSVSHELRTPLNTIIGMANLLQSTKLNKDQEEMVRSMDSASRLMLSLIEDVLDFSKIEAGKILIESTPFNLHQLIYDTTKLFKYQAAAKNLDLRIEMHPDVPEPVVGDPTHLRQILANLLSNALKFTEKGHVVLRIRTIGVDEHAARLRFEIEDTGIGIAPKAQVHIFESFTQADPSTTRQYGGTGLGTTISKQLAELMGGRLGFHSEVGVGSTFWLEIKLPVQQVAHEAGSSTRPLAYKESEKLPLQQDSSASSVSRQYRVLVAEDNSMNRKVIQKMLELAGHVCIFATHGREALSLLSQSSYDAAILDMNMPEMSGLEVMKTYRRRYGATFRFPFIMLSADVTQELRKECMASGFDEFLPKPVQITQLLSTIERLVMQYDQVSKYNQVNAPVDRLAPKRAPLSISSEILNFDILNELEELAEDDAFLSNLIDEFGTSTQTLLDELEDTLNKQLPTECKNILHTIKGSALGIGANSLQVICQEFETMSSQDLNSNTQLVISTVRKSFLVTKEALGHYRSQQHKVS